MAILQDPFITIDNEQYELKKVGPPPTPVDCTKVWGAPVRMSETACVNGKKTVTWQKTEVITAPPQNGGTCTPVKTETYTTVEDCVVIPPPTPGKIAAHGNSYRYDLAWNPPDTLDLAKRPPAIKWTAFVDAKQSVAHHAEGKLRKFRQINLFGNMPLFGKTQPAIFTLPDGTDHHDQLSPNFGPEGIWAKRGIEKWATFDRGAPAGPYPPGPYPCRPGDRGYSILSPYYTMYGHTRIKEDGTIDTNPNNPLWLMLQLDGRLQSGMRDGSIRDTATLPVPANSYANDMAMPSDIAKRKFFYYLDSVNGKIMHVDRTPTPWAVTEYMVGFGLLTSIKWRGDKLYVVERSTSTIWEIDVAAKSKRTVAVVAGAFWIDYDSQGQLVVMCENWLLRRINPLTGALGPVLHVPLGENVIWAQCSVDRTGSCGLKDTIYAVGFRGYAQNQMIRIFPDGTISTSIDKGAGYNTVGETRYTSEPNGHYLWTVACHPDEGLIATGGTYNSCIGMLQIQHESDPYVAPEPLDAHLGGEGMNMIQWGGTRAMYGVVPSFTCQVGCDGCSSLGITFDYIVGLGYQGAKDFILKGGIGSVPRTLTNAELWPMMYHMHINSQQYLVKGAPLIAGLRTFLGVT